MSHLKNFNVNVDADANVEADSDADGDADPAVVPKLFWTSSRRAKKDKIETPYLNASLHINMISHTQCQENPTNGLRGVAITNFF